MLTPSISGMRLRFRLELLVVISLLDAACARAVRVDTSSRQIFREVKLPDRTVVLATPFGDRDRYGTLVADTLLRLHEASFAGAQAIYVHLGPGDTVRGMTYEYGRERDFEKRVTDYYPLLGPPLERKRVPPPEASAQMVDHIPLELVVWQDKRTRFELHLDTVPGARHSRAVWLDRR
jgi:hypothetical protein